MVENDSANFGVFVVNERLLGVWMLDSVSMSSLEMRSHQIDFRCEPTLAEGYELGEQ